MNAFITWVFEDRDRATGALLIILALMVLATDRALQLISYWRDTADQDLEAAQDQSIRMVTEPPTCPAIPAQRTPGGAS